MDFTPLPVQFQVDKEAGQCIMILSFLFLFLFGGMAMGNGLQAGLLFSGGKEMISASENDPSALPSIIPFETIDRGAWLGGGIKKPGVVTVCSHMDLKKARTRLPALDFKKIQETNFDHYFVIIIYSGGKPTGGYGIKVWEIIQTGSKITIRVDDEEYGKGVDAATLPYHIIRLRRADLKQTGETTIVLLNSDGREVCAVTVNI